MNANRAGEIGVALIGLHALLMSLVALPSRLAVTLALPLATKAIEGAGSSPGTDAASLRVTQLGLFGTMILTVVPRLVVLLARRRIAAWLLPNSPSLEAGVAPDDLLRIGLVLLGAYLTITGLASFASLGSTQVRVGGVGEVKSTRGLAGPLIQLGGGVTLCLFSRGLSSRLGTRPQA